METSSRNWATARPVTLALIVAEVLAVLYPTFVLGTYFEFPDVLRQPADYAFALFARHQAEIVSAYYVFMLSGLLYIPLSCWLARSLADIDAPVGRSLLVGLGVATAVFQAIGFSRWVFVVPFLVQQSALHPEHNQTLTLLYELLNRYAGMTIGEHLGFLAMGGWTITLGTLLLRQRAYRYWLGVVGVFIGLLLMVSTGEHFGGPNAPLLGRLNFAANATWTLWLPAVGVSIGWPKKLALTSG